MSHAQDFHSALETILSLICQAIEWDYGEAWIESEDSKVLKCVQNQSTSDSGLSEFRQKSWEFTIVPGICLPGRIWVSQQPEWIDDVSSVPHDVYLRSQIAADAGLKAAFGVPILVNAQVLAILIFYRKQASIGQPRIVELELVNAVISQLGSLVQRKQAEEAQRIAEQRYHSIVENALEGIYQTTPAGHYLSVNPALAKIYGYDSPEELIKSIKDISQQLYVNPKRRQEFIATIEMDNAVYGFESLVYRKDGKAIWISETARAVRNSKGTLLYCEGTVSDITERKLVQEALKFQQNQTEELLLNILPQPIAVRLQQGQSPIADHFEEVSVLFADLVGFTEFSAKKNPAELVKVLNIIFSKFDYLAQRHGLEKIKTIGDAYMVVGGLPTPSLDRVEAIAQMALDMQQALAWFNGKTGEDFRLRIGINMGPVVAGVIGMSKFIYDLWGDTVNIASRMESTGMPGKIQVTVGIYERLKEQFCFEERGAIAVKGKGKMLTYWLTGKI
ncbi:MAG TPA: adenylate/guanylate cyclase with GAF sensor(s) [Cyanobacteria bacterium UBA8543]|nr:adenylate/guanylate cyclase with GAF sensor(s) [Cyanobacteria bacterium UBA8543]